MARRSQTVRGQPSKYEWISRIYTVIWDDSLKAMVEIKINKKIFHRKYVAGVQEELDISSDVISDDTREDFEDVVRSGEMYEDL